MTDTATIERWWIEQARNSPYYFIWYITGFRPARHHEIWMKAMLNPNSKRLNLVAARESAKTTITVYTIAWLLATNPFQTFGIVAVSSKVARDRLAMLRNLFSDNQRFRNVFPHIAINPRSPDTQDEFSIYATAINGVPIDFSQWRTLISQNGSQLVKNPSVFAAGNGGNGIIGRRVSGVLALDDMVDETYLSSDAQDKMIRYINQTLEPCITEEGRMWNIGTRWMIGDIYEQFEKNPKWRTITIPAIIYDDAGTPYSYWPEFWSLDRLEEKRLTMNDDILFRIMYLCDPTAVTAGKFQRETLFIDLPGELPPMRYIYISTDLAVSTRKSADWNVAYIVGIDNNQNVYVLDGIRYREEAVSSVDRIIYLSESALYTYGRLDNILFEQVGFQAYFEQLLRNARPDLPIQGVVPKGDKGHRAAQVAYWAQKRKLFINQRLLFIDQLRAEWFNFPKHRHDDTLDALSLLFQYVAFGSVQAQVMRINPADRQRTASAMLLHHRKPKTKLVPPPKG